jgi:hypothetical protein
MAETSREESKADLNATARQHDGVLLEPPTIGRDDVAKATLHRRTAVVDDLYHVRRFSGDHVLSRRLPLSVSVHDGETSRKTRRDHLREKVGPIGVRHGSVWRGEPKEESHLDVIRTAGRA